MVVVKQYCTISKIALRVRVQPDSASAPWVGFGAGGHQRYFHGTMAWVCWSTPHAAHTALKRLEMDARSLRSRQVKAGPPRLD
eukprot:1667280-Amphidinium_carterae.1